MTSLNLQEDGFTFLSFVKDRVRVLAVTAVCLLCLFGMIVVQNVGPQGALACCGLVALCVAAALVLEYRRRRRFFDQLQEAAHNLERAYHLVSLLDDPGFLEGRIFAEACREVCLADARDLSREREEAEANRRFVDLWTHEVKTPIAAAKLALARMHGPDAAALRLDVERIESACERALYNTRANCVSDDYDLAPVSPLRLCQDAAKSLSNLMISSKVTPVFEVDPALTMMADPSWVKFVLRQLISNGVKYGAATLRFSAWEENPGTPQGRLVLQVADDGKGIPAHDVPHVFERGYSGVNGREEGGSTGMGLYLSWKLCEAMGASITVASEVGKGTRVLMGFPLNSSDLASSRANLSEA